MNGEKSDSSLKVEKFVDILRQKMEEKSKNIDIALWDERLTTVMAYKTMRELNISQKHKKQYADKLAATYILEDFLKSTNKL